MAQVLPSMRPLKARWLDAIDQVSRQQWDRLAVPLDTPLLEWAWLHQLEASGSIAPQNGWRPRHLTLWSGHTLTAAAPLYIKTHSRGEFVFDHWWAQLAESHGLAYYPKMVGMSPATPAVGYQWLTDPEYDHKALTGRLLEEIQHDCAKNAIAAIQFNFVEPTWSNRMDAYGYHAWRHQSYLWQNPGYGGFDDYLQSFKSSQRKNIRREVNRMQTAGIRIRAYSGDAIDPRLAPVMYRYYLNTNAQYGPWAARFLNRAFFDGIFRHCRERMLVMAAHHPQTGETPVALSLMLVKNRHLIGRYWGCGVAIKDLHFNMCYYAPIRWAIANGITTFDPGAGSQHKIYRGFKAVSNTSLHRFSDHRFDAVFQKLSGEVNQLEQEQIDALNRKLPFSRRAGQGGNQSSISDPAP